MAKSKPRIIKNYEKLDDALREAIAAAFPLGYADKIQTFDIGGGRLMSALPFETEEFSYLIKFPINEDADIDNDAASADDQDDDLDLEGGEDVEEEDEDDEMEKSVGSLEDMENEMSDGR
ncbi:MAG: hypothetical protein J6Y82_05545 [Bacteroidales bacterium]|nr:hypothetical protein [Bacteroidales bacterium]